MLLTLGLVKQRSAQKHAWHPASNPAKRGLTRLSSAVPTNSVAVDFILRNKMVDWAPVASYTGHLAEALKH